MDEVVLLMCTALIGPYLLGFTIYDNPKNAELWVFAATALTVASKLRMYWRIWSNTRPSNDDWLSNYQPTDPVLWTLFYVPVCTLVFILFGAPIGLETAGRTISLAVFACILIFSRMVEAYPEYREREAILGRVFFRDMPKNEKERKIWSVVYGSCIGAWLGALLIPLDWDEPWQAWPLPVFYGSMVGWIVGRLLGPWLFQTLLRRLPAE